MGQYRELDVTVLSAQDLKSVKMMGAMNPYCVAWLYPHMKVSGAVCKGGGVSPVWNSVIKLVVEESLLEQGNANVTVDIYNHGTFSNKIIGSAQVPLADINAQAKGSSNASKSLSYQVRKKSGKHQGTINIAVRIGAVFSEAEAAKLLAPPSMGVPAMGMGGQYSQQYGNQQYGNQQYYPQQYPQQYPPQYGQQYQQPGARPRRGGMGGGAGLGLGAGLLGGMLLGSAMDGGDGGGCGGGGCGGGGCGG